MKFGDGEKVLRVGNTVCLNSGAGEVKKANDLVSGIVVDPIITGEHAAPPQTTVPVSWSKGLQSKKGIDIKDLASLIPDKNPELKALVKKLGLKGFIALILLIIFCSYFYQSLCLQLIAQKTGAKSAWLAWIPVANIFLMFNIAAVSYWWMVIMIVVLFIPLIGIVGFIGFSFFLYYKIILALHKPGWLAVLLIIPVVNLVMIGYLAFSKPLVVTTS